MIDAKVGRRRRGRKVNWFGICSLGGLPRTPRAAVGCALLEMAWRVVNLTERAGRPQHSRMRSIGETKRQGDRPATRSVGPKPSGHRSIRSMMVVRTKDQGGVTPDKDHSRHQGVVGPPSSGLDVRVCGPQGGAYMPAFGKWALKRRQAELGQGCTFSF